MNAYRTITVCILTIILLAAGSVSNSSPLKRETLHRLPPILLPEPYPEWIQMYRISQRNPAALLRYLDEAYLQRLVPGNSIEDERKRLGLRWYAVVRLGDIAGPELIPALEQYAQKYTTQEAREGQTHQDEVARFLHRHIERIRLRAQGRDVYVRAMIEWVRTPVPPASAANLREVDEGWSRVWAGARALGVLQAREGVDALMERARQPQNGFYDVERLCVRALARIGDRRALPILERAVKFWTPDYWVAEKLPLEPDEPDIVWAYWQMRTEGMTMDEVVADMIRAFEVPGLKAGQVLLHIGKPAVPALLAVLKDPGSSLDKKQGALSVLVGLRAKEAKGVLLDLLRHDTGDLARAAACGLGMLGAKESVPDLLKAAEQEDDQLLKESAIFGLGKLGDPAAEPVLLRLATQHPDPRVRREAVMALERAGTPAAIPVLEQRLQTEVDYLVGYIQNTIDALQKKKR